MNSNKQAVDVFKQYAEQKLENHLSELHTHYENESPGSETLKKGFDDHKIIFRKELDQKIKDLSDNNDVRSSTLNELKNSYVNKLSDSNFSK
jgi:hypothetical protein